jgi:DnaD/phage-associated family protein
VTAPTQVAPFTGFPAGARATAVPSAFFSHLLPQIEDATELRILLYVIYALGRRKGYPRFVTRQELAAEAPLVAALENDGDASEALDRGLRFCVERSTLLRLDRDEEGVAQTLFFLNTPADRRAIARIEAGELGLGRPLSPAATAPAGERGNVFRLYEENIGPITPLVADELREAERLYPIEWIEEAFREAAVLNKRSWRYAARILERWAAEGKQGEKAGRDSEQHDSIRSRIINRFDRLSGDR